jgi:Ca2+-binding EF-hand superfamily protein
MTKRTLGLAGMVTGALWTATAFAQQPATTAQPAQPQPAAAGANANPNAGAINTRDGDIPGPIDSLQDLQDTGKMAFKMADTNNDGQVSQKEATDAGNLIVGGFFFRADADGNGTLTREEANAAREALFRQQPLLRVVAQRAKAADAATGNNATPNPAAGLANLLDSNNDKQLQGTEVRQAVQTAVQGLYGVADTNRDGQMSPAEVNAAILGAARAAAEAAYAAADKDRNGSLSQEEFIQSVTEPAKGVFAALDLDGNGQLSPEEARRVQQVVGRQLQNLQVPEPANSATNIIGSGRVPQQGAGAAPVPDLNIRAPQPGQPAAQPAQPAAPAVPR